jgi:DNA-binding CsgD family transcriptional regulator
MQYLIENFIEDTNAAMSHDEIFAFYSNALNKFGYDRIVYTFLTDFPSIHQKAGHGIKCNYPDDWMKDYQAKGYEKIDPVISQVLRDPFIFTWDSLSKIKFTDRKQLHILQEGEEAGLKDGVGVPLYGASGGLAGVGLASSIGGIKPDKNMLSKINALTMQFHLAYCALGSSESKKDYSRPELTAKEKEVLQWWAKGKSSDEIADIMGCSKRTIKFHVANIYLKLQANTKILAITKSIRLGIIPLDIVKV